MGMRGEDRVPKNCAKVFDLLLEEVRKQAVALRALSARLHENGLLTAEEYAALQPGEAGCEDEAQRLLEAR